MAVESKGEESRGSGQQRSMIPVRAKTGPVWGFRSAVPGKCANFYSILRQDVHYSLAGRFPCESHCNLRRMLKNLGTWRVRVLWPPCDIAGPLPARQRSLRLSTLQYPRKRDNQRSFEASKPRTEDPEFSPAYLHGRRPFT